LTKGLLGIGNKYQIIEDSQRAQKYPQALRSPKLNKGIIILEGSFAEGQSGALAALLIGCTAWVVAFPEPGQAITALLATLDMETLFRAKEVVESVGGEASASIAKQVHEGARETVAKAVEEMQKPFDPLHTGKGQALLEQEGRAKIAIVIGTVMLAVLLTGAAAKGSGLI
jgi:hypothetical protein